jgi:hypothetical protein
VPLGHITCYRYVSVGSYPQLTKRDLHERDIEHDHDAAIAELRGLVKGMVLQQQVHNSAAKTEMQEIR